MFTDFIHPIQQFVDSESTSVYQTGVQESITFPIVFNWKGKLRQVEPPVLFADGRIKLQLPSYKWIETNFSIYTMCLTRVIIYKEKEKFSLRELLDNSYEHKPNLINDEYICNGDDIFSYVKIRCYDTLNSFDTEYKTKAKQFVIPLVLFPLYKPFIKTLQDYCAKQIDRKNEERARKLEERTKAAILEKKEKADALERKKRTFVLKGGATATTTYPWRK